jgi:enolase
VFEIKSLAKGTFMFFENRSFYGIVKKNSRSMKQTKITKIQAREILDSRGNPTVETTIWAGDNFATASVPSGASTGVHEAVELRDNDAKRYGGLGVLKACRHVNEDIFKVIHGRSARDQAQIDQKMLELDSTPDKSRLGANAILSVSLATARLSAKINNQELYIYLAQYYDYGIKNMPTPLFNVINGGKHADSGLDVQEFFLIPQKGKFAERLRAGSEVYHQLKRDLKQHNLSTDIGDEGGFAPHLPTNQRGLALLAEAIKKAGYHLGTDFRLGVDAAASEFFDVPKQLYHLKASNLKYKPSNIYKLYMHWVQQYHLQIVEDGCAEDDFAGWQLLTQHLGKSTLLVGDDLFATNVQRIQNGIINDIANAVLIKINQIGTLTETLAAIKLAQANQYKVVISHRSGETLDSFIADLAVAVNADFIKAGAPARGERLAKYNRLAEIESQL